MNFDEINAPKEVNKLANLLRQEGNWTYFITLTCNDYHTFGVSVVRHAIDNHYGDNKDMLRRVLESYCSILCRIWERSVYFRHLLHSDERILGRIKETWYRFEFQTGFGHGSKPHVHGGVVLYDDDKEEKIDLERITCQQVDTFSSDVQTDIDCLYRDGICSSLEDHRDLQKLYREVQFHSCQNSGKRCMKVDRNGEVVCRVPRNPASNKYGSKRFIPYSDETLETLLWLDLAVDKRNDMMVPENILPHESLVGYRYTYPASRGETCVPTNPRQFCLFQSNTNVQHVGNLMKTNYLVKYAANADEKREIVLEHSQTAGIDASVSARDLFNEKNRQ